MASQVRSAVSLTNSPSSGVQARGARSVTHRAATSLPSLINGAAMNAPIPAAATAGRSASGIRVDVRVSATTTGPPLRSVGANPGAIAQRISADDARDARANEVAFDQDVALRFVDADVAGAIGQQPLAEKPAGLFLNGHRIDQQSQGIAKPEKKRVPRFALDKGPLHTPEMMKGVAKPHPTLGELGLGLVEQQLRELVAGEQHLGHVWLIRQLGVHLRPVVSCPNEGQIGHEDFERGVANRRANRHAGVGAVARRQEHDRQRVE